MKQKKKKTMPNVQHTRRMIIFRNIVVVITAGGNCILHSFAVWIFRTCRKYIVAEWRHPLRHYCDGCEAWWGDLGKGWLTIGGWIMICRYVKYDLSPRSENRRDSSLSCSRIKRGPSVTPRLHRWRIYDSS